jgi:hypothetical protein
LSWASPPPPSGGFGAGPFSTPSFFGLSEPAFKKIHIYRYRQCCGSGSGFNGVPVLDIETLDPDWIRIHLKCGIRIGFNESGSTALGTGNAVQGTIVDPGPTGPIGSRFPKERKKSAPGSGLSDINSLKLYLKFGKFHSNEMFSKYLITQSTILYIS